MSRITRFEESFKLRDGSEAIYVYLRQDDAWYVAVKRCDRGLEKSPWPGFPTLAKARNMVLWNVCHPEQKERRAPCELPPLSSE